MKDGKDKNNKAITIKKASDTTEEKTLIQIQKGGYDFVVSERSPLLYVSTKLNEASLFDIPGFSLLYSGGIDKIKRFCVPISKDEFIKQLQKIYPSHAIVWIE